VLFSIRSNRFLSQKFYCLSKPLALKSEFSFSAEDAAYREKVTEKVGNLVFTLDPKLSLLTIERLARNSNMKITGIQVLIGQFNDNVSYL